MTLRPLATRVPKEIEKEIHDVMEFLNVGKAQAVRIILESGISEWRKRTALELLRDGKLTFGKAAKLAKLDVWELADLIKERKIEWVKISAREFGEEAEKASKAAGE